LSFFLPYRCFRCSLAWTGPVLCALGLMVVWTLLIDAEGGAQTGEDDASTAERIHRRLEQAGSGDADRILRTELDELPEKKAARVLLRLMTYDVDALSKFPGPRAVREIFPEYWEQTRSGLIELLDHENALKRGTAAFMIRKSLRDHDVRSAWHETPGPALVKLLEGDPSPRVRRQAAWALGQFDDHRRYLAEAMVSGLRDDAFIVRQFTLIALKGMGPDVWKTRPLLIDILEDPHAFIGDADTDQQPVRLVESAAEAIGGMRYAGYPATEALLRVSARRNARPAHREASTALYNVVREDPDVPVSLVKKAIQTSRYPGPVHVALKLGVRSPEMAETLMNVFPELTADRLYRGERAVEALAELDPEVPEGVRYLRLLATSSESYARACAAGAYGLLADDRDRAGRFLASIMDRAKGEAERDFVVDVGGRLGPHARPLLDRIDPDTNAEYHGPPLQKIESYYRIRGVPDQYFDYVTDQFRQGSHEAGSTHAEDILVRLGGLAREAIPTLRSVIQNEPESPRINRYRAVRVLGHIGPSKAARSLVPLLKRRLDPDVEPSPYNRRIIAETIWHLSRDAETAVNALVRLLDERKVNFFYTVDALKKMGPAASGAVPRLKEALEDPNPFFREKAREALREIQNGPAGSADPNREQLKRWYRQLSKMDAWTSVDATWHFVQAGEKGARFLRDPDRSALFFSEGERKRILNWIRALRARSYRRRERAMDRLRNTLPASRRLLQEQFRDTEHPEARHRLKRLLRESERRYPHDSLPMNRRFERVKQIFQLLDRRDGNGSEAGDSGNTSD